MVILTADAVPAILHQPTERTVRKPTIRDGVWGAPEKFNVVRSRRDGRWGWLDVDRDQWYPSIAVAGAATILANTGANNWNTNGAWVGGVQPTAADDVTIPASAVVTIAAATTALCRSILVAALGTIAFAATTSNLNVGDGGGGAAQFNATSTVTLTAVGTINFVSTSDNGGTGWGITSGGKTLPNVTINGVGNKMVLQDAFNIGAAALTVTSGGFFGNAQTSAAGSLASSITNVRTIDITNCAVTLSGTGTAWTVAAGGTSNLTLVTTGSTITFTGAGASMSPGGGSYNSVVHSGSGTATVNYGASTSAFVNLTRTGTAVKTDALQFTATTGTLTLTGTFTLGGNTTQGVNRLLVLSSTVGTQRTIIATGAAVVISGDVDFADIDISGSPSWTNTGSKFVGDMGGNGTLITTNRTTPATQTATGTASFTWSTHGWTSRVPLPQDTVLIPNAFIAGRTVTNDMQRMGGSVSFAGCTGSPAFTSSVGAYICGSLTLVAGMTTSGTTGVVLAGRSANTITTAGVVWAMTLTVSCGAGSYTLADAFTSSRSAQSALNIATGTLVDAGFTVTLTGNAGTFVMTGGALTKTGAWVFQTTNALTFWNITGGTVSDTAGSITLSTTSANTRVFAGGGQSYKVLTHTVAGSTGQLTIADSNTFATINFSDVTNARTLAFTAATTTTITTLGGLNVNGTAGKLMTITSVTAATHILTSTFNQTVNYTVITQSAADPTGSWIAYNSTDSGSPPNTGWRFLVAAKSLVVQSPRTRRALMRS